jgi:hypothetical protein
MLDFGKTLRQRESDLPDLFFFNLSQHTSLSEFEQIDKLPRSLTRHILALEFTNRGVHLNTVVFRAEHKRTCRVPFFT